MTDILRSVVSAPRARLLLAHGAGAPMDSPFLALIVQLLADRQIEVWRFEFPYMAERRTGGKKRPAPKPETLMGDFQAVVALAADGTLPVFIGGKSMGGRVASMIAQGLYNERTIAGLVCLGYPFHPPQQPQTWRINHLVSLSCPTLIVQGERDPFGSRGELAALPVGATLAPAIDFHWIGDGDHDFGPRGGKGFTRKGNLIAAADAVATFVDEHALMPTA